MSVSSCLLFFILCLSLHFCDCRILGSVEKKKSEDRKFDISATSKVEDNNNTTRFVHQHAIDAMHPLLPDQSMKDEKSGAKESNSEDSISLNRKTEKIKANKERKRSSSGNPKGSNSPASISWHVRHHEKQPSDKDTELFDSDYCPPKTHPPSHN